MCRLLSWPVFGPYLQVVVVVLFLTHFIINGFVSRLKALLLFIISVKQNVNKAGDALVL